jgi:two-component system OmpR family response regulator
MNILIVDDSRTMRMMVRRTLRQAGLNVDNAVEAENGKEALDKLRDFKPDLILSDWNMPELDGLEACRRIRAASRVPIVFLSSRDEEFDRVLGLELGGDDYVTKPFSPRELVARVRTVLRRAAAPAPAIAYEVVRAGPLRLDVAEHRAWVGAEGDEQEIVLTVTEFALLRVLARRPGRVYTRDELVERAYGEGHHIADRTIDSHVRNIRAKLRAAGGDDMVETVHGLGWRLRR